MLLSLALTPSVHAQRSVTVGVFARDAKGQLLTDLTAADFSIFDNGKLQPLDAPERDGKYHKLRVVCARKDVRLEARKGYLAEPK